MPELSYYPQGPTPTPALVWPFAFSNLHNSPICSKNINKNMPYSSKYCGRWANR